MASMYVYGVGRAIAAPPSCRGLADAPLDVVRHGELAAIVSSIPATTVRARRQDLMRHSDVLQAAFDRHLECLLLCSLLWRLYVNACLWSS